VKLLPDAAFNLDSDLAAIRSALTGKLESLSARKSLPDSVRLYFVDGRVVPFAVFDAVPGDLLTTMFYANQAPGADALSSVVHVAVFDKNELLGTYAFPAIVVIWAMIFLSEFSAMDMTFFHTPAREAVLQKLIERGEYPPRRPDPED